MAFNSAEYSWSDVEIVLLGRKVTGAKAIKFKTSQEKDYIRASGNKPKGFAYGDKSYEGEITLLQSEVEALIEAAGKGKEITDIHGSNIVVAFAPLEGGRIKTHIVEYVEFLDFEYSMKQGDKHAEIAIPFKALEIKYNV
jgi:hypothetical protein